MLGFSDRDLFPTKHGRLLVTAGPTHEAIDEVRYVANRSSGRMGIAIAAAAAELGWETTLLLGPGPSSPPHGVETIRFNSTSDLEALLREHFPAHDVLVMAAAVADYRPRMRSTGKLERKPDVLTLELEKTPDLVARCVATRRPSQRVLAFALEEQAALHDRAREKLRRKGADAIVANPLETMDSDDIRALLITADGKTIQPIQDRKERIDKRAFADWIVKWMSANWGAQHAIDAPSCCFVG